MAVCRQPVDDLGVGGRPTSCNPDSRRARRYRVKRRFRVGRGTGYLRAAGKFLVRRTIVRLVQGQIAPCRPRRFLCGRPRRPELSDQQLVYQQATLLPVEAVLRRSDRSGFQRQIYSTLAACAGATISDVINTQLHDLNKSFDAVTISAGGNDIGFSKIATDCEELNKSKCDADLINANKTLLSPSFASKLTTLYEDILSAAPKANVYVMGVSLPVSPERLSVLRGGGPRVPIRV